MYSKKVRITWKGCGLETLIKSCANQKVAFLVQVVFEMDGKLWALVIFSDEARIELYSRRRQYVRRPVGQRFHNIYTMKTVKYGSPSILIWGAVKSDRTKVLCRCPLY